MALPTQRLKFRKYHSKYDPAAREAYALPGIAIGCLSFFTALALENLVAASLVPLLPASMATFFIVDRFRDDLPNFAKWATLTVAAAAMVVWATFLVWVWSKIYSTDTAYSWVKVFADLVFLIVGAWFFLNIARYNLPKPNN